MSQKTQQTNDLDDDDEAFAEEELEVEKMWRAGAAAEGQGYPEPEPEVEPEPEGGPQAGPRLRIPPISDIPEPRVVDVAPDWFKGEWPYNYEKGGGVVASQWDAKIDATMFPDNSLYQLYLKWATAVTDVPVSHHWAALTTVLGAVLGPGHRIAHGVDSVTPNLYTIIIADSGARKSYALNMITKKKMLPDIMLTKAIPKSDSVLLDMLAETPWRLFALDECGALFNQLGTSWCSALTHFLIEAYSGDEIAIRARGVGKSVKVSVESVSFLGATTLRSLSDLPRRELDLLLEGGLFGRFFFCPGRSLIKKAPEGERRPPKNWMPEPLACDEEFQTMFGGWLTRVYMTTPLPDKSGKRPPPNIYRLASDARIELCRWLYQIDPQPPSTVLGPIWSRLGLFAKKLGLIYHVAQGLNCEEPISEQTLTRAIRAITYYLIPSYRVLTEQMGNTMFRPVINKLRSQLLNTPAGVRYSDICVLCGIRREERLDALVALHNDIHYEIWMDQNKAGRPHLVVVWGKKPLPLKFNGKDVRKDEARVSGQDNADPPDVVAKALHERKDWPRPDIDTPEELDPDELLKVQRPTEPETDAEVN